MKFSFKPKTKLEKFGFNIYSALVENFPETYFVGGTTRDFLLLKTAKDIDIATSATPEEVAFILKKYFINFNSGYKNFGVIVALSEKLTAAIATFRSETYTGSRFPQIKFVTSAKTDSSRRDFTINSLYFSPKNQKILDFYGGVKDIKNKTIKFVGNPKNRILQDPLRMLRALRLSLELGLNLDPTAFLQIKNSFDLLQKYISKNKIAEEIEKLKSKKNKLLLKNILVDKNLLDKHFKSSYNI